MVYNAKVFFALSIGKQKSANGILEKVNSRLWLF